MPLHMSTSGGDEPLDSLRLTESEWRRLVDEIDRESSRHRNADDGRRHERMPYRNTSQLLATLQHLDGRTQRFLIRPHDLSTSGLGFLHGSFVYTGSRIQVVLVHRSFGAQNIEGTVRRCDLFKRHIHRVGLEFDEEIVLEDFVMAVA